MEIKFSQKNANKSQYKKFIDQLYNKHPQQTRDREVMILSQVLNFSTVKGFEKSVKVHSLSLRLHHSISSLLGMII